MNVRTTEMLRGLILGCIASASALVGGASADAQVVTQMKEDPQTGDLYQETTRPVIRPVTEERLDTQTYYRPETVKETRPEHRTSYTPVTQIKWMPYLEGRWNPFRQPTVAYRQVPVTHWEARSEVVDRTTWHTRYVAEQRTVPHRLTRYETKYETDLKLVQRGEDRKRMNAVASRLVPVGSTGTLPSGSANTMVATNDVGRSTSAPPMRNSTQSGMRTNVLAPTDPYAAPGNAPTSIATVPAYSLLR